MIAINQGGGNGKKRHAKKEAFLAAYAKVGVIIRAAKLAKIDRDSHRRWLRDDPDYRRRFDEAHEEACEHLEAEARRRAVDGVLRPVYQGGKKIGTIREFSDTLLIFLMKGAMPAKYRERFEHSGNVDHNLTVSPEVMAAAAVARQQLLNDRKLLTNGNGHNGT